MGIGLSISTQIYKNKYSLLKKYFLFILRSVCNKIYVMFKMLKVSKISNKNYKMLYLDLYKNI